MGEQIKRIRSKFNIVITNPEKVRKKLTSSKFGRIIAYCFRWIYLEPIFGSGTLEHERARFYRVDRDFRNLMKFAENDSRVCALCRYLNLNTILNNLLDQLSRCQSSLDKFLYVSALKVIL